jgi:hypothetical protein
MNNAAKRDQLWQLLGDLPPRDRQITATVLSTEERANYVLETIVLDLNGIEAVPAYFVRPHKLNSKAPAILYNHAHGGDYVLGKNEFLNGRDALVKPPYADAIAKLGWVGLCIDTWNFGERRGRTESSLFKELLWNGQVLWGLMVYDSIRALDYLTTRPEVDATRVATLGLSLGSTMAWWVAALDERIKVCVDICCLTEFQTFIDERSLDAHGLYYYVPSLLKHFTTASINALIAPRPHLGLAGNHDVLTPARGLDKIDGELKKVYAECGAPEAWKLLRYETGHLETAAMRNEIMAWLRRWL